MIYTNKTGATIDISDFCLESLPCKHVVRIDNKEICMDGVEIAKYLKENGFEMIDHFKSYIVPETSFDIDFSYYWRI